MSGRSTAGDNPIKPRRRKPATPTRGDALKAERIRGPTIDDLRKQLDRRTRELHEALEQQTATAEVLRVISSSPSDLAPVLQTILANATRLCAANFGLLALYENGAFRRPDAVYNVPEAFVALRRRQGDIDYGPTNPLMRLAATKEALHIADVRTDVAFLDGNEAWVQLVELTQARSLLLLPMLKGNELVGAIAIYRQEVLPFTDKQHELAQNFAAQAVIAIENARLLNELRQLTTDLTESLEQQTGTSEVLRVISSSPGELEPVFQTILENATQICGANFAIFSLREGEALRNAAVYNMPEAYMEFRRRMPLTISPKHPLASLAATKHVVHVADLKADDGYREGDPSYHAMVDLAGARTLLLVPMLKEQEIIGAITIFRQEVRLFTDKQIELVENFASQAVIAIENARLLNELRQRTTDLTERTADLTEALERQTATSEVLQVISSFPGDLQPVFATMLENAVRICDAKFGNIYRWDGDALHIIASHNTPAAFAEQRRREPFRPSSKNAVGQMIATKTVVHTPDVVASEAYIERDPVTVAGVEVAGIRTFLAVPMLKENELVGTFALARQEVRPFTDKQVELVTNFAAPAVIAIENARSLNELRQRTDE